MDFVKGLVSVIIPTYKRVGMITRVLDSVWNQTYRPIELLVVNDGSPDNTEEVVSEWIAKHSETVGFSAKLITQPNAGGCSARNNGLSHASGEFIQFFDDDDELCRTAFEAHVNNLREHSEVSSSLGQATYIADKGSLDTSYRLGYLDGRKDFVELVKNLPSPSFVLFRHEALKKGNILWDTDLPCAQDTDFMVQTLLTGNTFFSINHISSKIYFHTGTHVSNGLSSFKVESFKRLLNKWFTLANANGRDDDLLREGLSYLVYFRLRRIAIAREVGSYSELCKTAKELGCDRIAQVKFAGKHSIGVFLFRLRIIRLLNRLKIFGKFF